MHNCEMFILSTLYNIRVEILEYITAAHLRYQIFFQNSKNIVSWFILLYIYIITFIFTTGVIISRMKLLKIIGISPSICS